MFGLFSDNMVLLSSFLDNQSYLFLWWKNTFLCVCVCVCVDNFGETQGNIQVIVYVCIYEVA
jgi:hypothetical protein